ncbi:MAG: hypothetical protein NT096_02955 [Proteobacteria bacterium]|nr:hypothetical protein [Pseudomonadota bacterium]
MFESQTKPLLSRPAFFARLVFNIGIGFFFICISLGIGMVGYHYFEHFSWIDSFANAAMILSGMGPLTALQTKAGKLFAGFYALFSGLALIVVVGIIFAPMVHRFLHKFHLEDEESKTEDS